MAWGLRIGLRMIAMRGGGVVAPPPPVHTHGWFGGGSVGATRQTIVDRITFADDSTNALDRCDLTMARCALASFADSTYCWFGGGAVWYGPPHFTSETNRVDRITLADDTVNAIDRCDLVAAKHAIAGFTDNTYGWFGGGYPVPQHTKVERITLADDTTNAIYRCEMSATYYTAFTDLTHGWFGVGGTVERITLSNDTVNAVYRCALSVNRWSLGSITNYTYGWFGGGYTGGGGSLFDVVDRITLANDTVNAIDRCDLTVSRSGCAAVTNSTYGWFGGGYTFVGVKNTVDRITLANDTVNAIDKCDLDVARSEPTGSAGTP